MKISSRPGKAGFFCSLFLAAAWPLAAGTAELPTFDIALVDLQSAQGKPQAGSEFLHLTFRAGYDNQPAFSADSGTVYFTRALDDQTDIFAYRLDPGQLQQVTRTPESEYSPTPVPGRSAISVVRVEADQRQRLWQIELPSGQAGLLLADIEPVGYHAWAGPDQLALFVLAEPPQLQWANTATGKGKVLADNIGRWLQPVPDSNAVSFVQKRASGGWLLRRVDRANPVPVTIAPALEETEDYVWHPAGFLVAARGSQLYWLQPGDNARWQAFADLAERGVREISRLAISPDGRHLAVVHRR